MVGLFSRPEYFIPKSLYLLIIPNHPYSKHMLPYGDVISFFLSGGGGVIQAWAIPPPFCSPALPMPSNGILFGANHFQL